MKPTIKKVLLISHEMTYTGAPRSLLNMSSILREWKILVEVWTLRPGEFEKEFRKVGIHVEKLNELTRERIEKFDLVILNTFFTAYLVEFMQTSVRTILYLREAQNIPQLALDCHLDINDIQKANEVVCVSEYAEKFLRKVCCPQKLTVIHNFVKDEYKGQLNVVRKNTIHFMISGTYEWRKGHDIVLNAFLNMPQELKEITRLHIVGQKPEWAKSYWEQLEKLYDDRVIDHGEIADEKERMQLYKKMNVFIIASRDESCSLVALEGAMLGKALIMSQNVGAQYLDRRQRWVYPTEDSGELCRKMCELTSRKILMVCGIEMRWMYEKTSTKKMFRKSLKCVLE